MTRSIIIGMGIGQLYHSVLTSLGHEIITVDKDPSKGADYTELQDAIDNHKPFDTAHVCTPNFTHMKIASHIAPVTSAVFIEKPGVANSIEWQQLLKMFPQTHFMMVKNNMWRSNIAELQDLAKTAKLVNFNWINRNRVPSPGTWFTTKDLSFGGVSRDLMPHLLSLYIALNPSWVDDPINKVTTLMRYELKDLIKTDYGTVNADGVYNVDDLCQFKFADKWNLHADWRNLKNDDRSIEFVMQNNSSISFELGLCPEEAYTNMLKDAIDHIGNYEWWTAQSEQDLWIHKQIENL